MAGRGRDKGARGAHIRKSTLGTSNELSFSVLDAASNKKGRNEKKRAKSAWKSFDQGLSPTTQLTPPPGEISLFTMGSDGRPPSTPRKEKGITLSTGEFISTDNGRGSSAMPLSEVAIRKRSRRRAQMVGVMASIILVLAVVAGLTSLVASLVNTQNVQQSQLKELVQQLEQTDDTLLALDGGVQAVTGGNEIGEEELSGLEQLLEQGNSAVLAELDEIKAKAGQLEERLMTGTDREVANNLMASAQARAAMIESGYNLLEQALPLREAQEQAHQGWQSLGQAENLSRQAAEALNPLNSDTVVVSRDYSEQALQQLQQAKQQFSRAAEVSSAVDLSLYNQYLQLKINASSAAIEADNAYLARDKELMDERNTASNNYEAEAAACLVLAEANPNSAYDKAFSNQVDTLLQGYQVERNNASVADERLREFLS